MTFSKPEIAVGVLKTRRGIYSLSSDIDVIPERFLLLPGSLVAGLVFLFTIGFADLLYPHELVVSACLSLASLFAGFSMARLVIVKSTLRGSEYAVAAFGSFGAIRRLAEDIVDAALAVGEDRS